MNGAMFYLREEVKLVKGHIIFMDSEWALTAISQVQFWPAGYLAGCGNGNVNGVLSVDISDWDTCGRCGKPAKACTEEEIRQEVRDQMVRHLPVGSLDHTNVELTFSSIPQSGSPIRTRPRTVSRC